MKRLFLVFSLFSCFLLAMEAQRVTVHEQQSFPDSVPAGGYSGITWLGDDLYAVVSDNMPRDGFFLFRISLTASGDLASVKCLGFRQNEGVGKDSEGIAFFAPGSTLFVSGEKDNEVRELTMKGQPTGRRLPLPVEFQTATRAYGLEALTYNARTHRFWTTSESTLPCDGKQASPACPVSNLLRFQSFDDRLRPRGQYLYRMEEPTVEHQADNYALGVSALTALDDGRLLVLEREVFVPRSKLGAFTKCHVYVVSPSDENLIAASARLGRCKAMKKTLLTEWESYIGLLDFSLANYEGMCAGPRLEDGGQVIVMLSDSQNQYAGVLQDWFRTMVVY